MVTENNTEKKISDELESFYISREALGVQPRTLDWYRMMLDRYERYLRNNDICFPSQLTAQVMENFLSTLRRTKMQRYPDKSLSDSTIHGYARAIRAFYIYLYTDGCIDKRIIIKMPKVSKHQNRVLNIAEVRKLIATATSPRDKAIVYLAIDSGLRLSEIVGLAWKDIDLNAATLVVRHGKGDKFRVVTAGAKTRMAIIRYRRTLKNCDGETAIFQTESGKPLTRYGLVSLFSRLSRSSGIKFSAHALRRTFAKFSVQNGMDITVVQQLLGHENVETTRHYVQDLDTTFIVDNHKKHGVIDHL
jgi:integrase/recombinase XerD